MRINDSESDRTLSESVSFHAGLSELRTVRDVALRSPSVNTPAESKVGGGRRWEVDDKRVAMAVGGAPLDLLQNASVLVTRSILGRLSARSSLMIKSPQYSA